MTTTYDALLVLSFGGPEGPDDVIPFLENVLRGRNVPRERMLEVAEHYQEFGGVSPINGQNRELIAELEEELAAHDHDLPIYFGNRNWHPMLTDTLRTMWSDGVRRALVFVTSTFSSYSGCRQYRENLADAREALGGEVPEFDKIRVFFNHPGFIEATVELIESNLRDLPDELRDEAEILYTAHSLPLAMASSCRYVEQLEESCRLVSERLAFEHPWRLVYQSRSGPPSQPWLEPDVVDVVEEVAATGRRSVIVVPIGFLSDHMEVLFDLDTEARERAEELGLAFRRVPTVGTHPRFVAGLRELVEEYLGDREPAAIGRLPAPPRRCAPGCCPPATRQTGRPGRSGA